MKCIKCGKEVFNDAISFCPSCGNFLVNDEADKKNKHGFRLRIVSIFLILILFWGLIIALVVHFREPVYYFATTKEKEQLSSEEVLGNEEKEELPQNNIVIKEGETKIVYNKKYEKQTLRSIEDVYAKIVEDSVSQKEGCSSEILSIENDIINTYHINAVNLCEMDVAFARELRDVVGYYYNTYPQTRDHLTNITLANVDDSKTYMAAFMPIFTFLTSNTSTTYPIGLKTQIILNSKYFLNVSKMKNSVKYGSDTGYFPPNATRSSTVAHEFGHYVSYIALIHYYETNSLTYVGVKDIDLLFSIYDDFNAGDFSYQIILEAYDKYVEMYGNTLSYDQFRESISSYAVSKDNSGAYIYDETIAEAFHDCYLNKEKAKEASKLIVEVLLSYL